MGWVVDFGIAGCGFANDCLWGVCCMCCCSGFRVGVFVVCDCCLGDAVWFGGC